ncbi:MAG: hypothetical protein ACXVDV_20025 [Bacteroidia bacterium]
MKNEEIPHEIWELKNEAVRVIQNYAISNDMHYQYKQNWDYLGAVLEKKGKEIQALIKQYQQPKED